MANPSDVSIPTPMASGATDNPDAPQPSGEPQAPPTPAGFSDTPQLQPPPVPAGFSDKPPVETPGHGASSNWTPPAKTQTTQKQTTSADVAKHGLLSRAWEWVNQPIFDNVLPEGVKTADIIKAAAFEGMYHQAYIPGVNDFDTMAEQHFGGAKGEKPSDSQTKAAIRAFINGVGKDTSDMAAGFTSPLAVGTMGLGSEEVQGAAAAAKLARVAKFAKYSSRFAGTAFGAQGLYQAGHGVKGMLNGGVTPENLQETLGGLGQATLAGAGEAHVAGRALEDSVRPVMKNIHGQEVPVRPSGLVPETIAKTVEPSVIDAATRKTEAAVQTGVGNVAGEAVGSDATTDVHTKDRFGLRGHAEDLIENQSRPIMQKLDQLSDRAFSDAQKEAKKYARDFTGDGREKFQAALDAQDRIVEEHRPLLESQGYDVDAMRANYRKGIAVQKIATAFDAATGPREGGGYEIDGEKLAKTIDRLRRAPEDKNLFDKAGMTDTHVNALADLADTLRKEQVTPKFGGLTKLAAKALAFMIPSSGIRGIAEALTGEAMAEKFGSKIMTHLVGEAMTSEPSARQLTAALKQGPQALSGWDKFKSVVKSLWSDETGSAAAPGRVPLTAEDRQVSGNFNEVEHDEYADAVQSNPQAATLTDPEDMEGNRKFSNGEGVYYSISPEGDLQGVVNNSGKRGALAKVMPHAIEQGAKTLDAWDLFLPKQYEKYGFERTERVPYDVEKYGEPSEQLKSAWRQQGWKDGDDYPAVQYMRLRPSLELHHWSNVSGLTETDPATMGTGKAGREMARSKEPGFLKRTNFGTEGYKEPAIQGQKFHYVAKANPAEYYDAKSDPQGIWQKAFQEGGATAAENAVKDAGYKGYRVGNEVASFEKVPVKPVDAEAERLKQIAQPKRDTDLMGQARKKLGPDAPLSAVAQEAARMAEAARTASAAQQSAAAAPAVEPMKPELEIGTRYPRAKDATGENNPDHMPNMDAMEQAEKHTPGYFDKLIESLRGYDGANGLDLEDRGQGSKKVLDGVINHFADNLRWLHDNTPGYVRGISKQWYDTANKMTKDMAGRYGIAHEKMAAVVAALSPKNGWDNNVGMADRLVNIWKNSRDHGWDTEMENKLNKITGNPKLKANYRDMLNSIRGQKYGDLTAKSEAALLAKKGLWIRIFDEAHNSRQTPVYAPDGTIRAHQTLAWGMPDPMAKAIAILEGPEGVDHINDTMGDKNKIRSFYNNIINPNSFRGHVTVDTHAVNATMLKPLGSDDDEVWHNFSGAPGHADTGLAGTYAVHAEAYRRAAAKLGLKPRELQSITWEAIRTLFGDDKKTPELKAKVNEIWQRYAGRAADPGVKAPGGDFESRPTAGVKKSLTLDQVRDEIVKAAGGFSRPVWGEQDWKSKVKGTGDAGPRVGEGKFRDSATEFNPESFSANPNEAVGDNLQQPQHQSVTLGQGPTTMNVDATPAASPEVAEKWQGKPAPLLKRTPSGQPDWNGKYGPSLKDVADHLNANVTPEDMTFATAHEMAHAFLQHHFGVSTEGMNIGLGNRAVRKGVPIDGVAAVSSTDGVSGGFVSPGKGWEQRHAELDGDNDKAMTFVRDFTTQLMAGKAMEELLGQKGTVAAEHAKADRHMAGAVMEQFGIPAHLHDVLMHNATQIAKGILQENFDTLHHLTRQAVKHYGKHFIDEATFHHYREGGEYKEPDEK